MKHRNLILIISILFFASCKEITKDDIKGNWKVVPRGYDELIYWEINFKEDKAELIDDNLFKELGEYQVENGKIKIKLDRDDLIIETEIKRLDVDTLLVFDSLMYHRNRAIPNSKFEEYKLIGIPTNRLLSKEKDLFHIIHFYKSNEEIQIRCGDTKTTFEDLPLFLEGGHFKPKVLIFIGEGINLKDLKRIYFRLASIHQLRIWLGTKREGISDTHIINDKIEIWWDDLENHLANSKIRQPSLPPPPMEFTSKENYLKNGGKEIKISNKNDLLKIDELTEIERYVISINSNLSIEDYLEVKERLNEKRKLNRQIITEIE